MTFAKYELFGSIPRLSDLIVVNLLLDPLEKRDESTKSDFQWKTLKSRIIIFSYKNLLISPKVGPLNIIQVVLKRDCYCAGHLLKLCQEQNLKEGLIESASPQIFEECFNYTFVNLLSPTWNKVGTIFLEGKHFLTCNGNINAASVDLAFSDEFFIATVNIFQCFLPKLNLNDYINTLENQICDISQLNSWVHVLPSLKRGKIVSMSRNISPLSSFQNYNEIRKHWKNMYGYRLPRNEEQMIFVGIQFFDQHVFTYPIECLLSHIPILNPHNSSDYEFEKIYNYLTQKLPSVCGTPVNMYRNVSSC